MRGTIVEFDEARGLGLLASEGATHPFHCTAITDGTRTIAVGAEVTFELRPGGMGRWEATEITPLSVARP